MRILVTGGAGYIGSHPLLQLLRERLDVLVYDNYSISLLEALSRVKQLAKLDVDEMCKSTWNWHSSNPNGYTYN